MSYDDAGNQQGWGSYTYEYSELGQVEEETVPVQEPAPKEPEVVEEPVEEEPVEEAKEEEPIPEEPRLRPRKVVPKQPPKPEKGLEAGGP